MSPEHPGGITRRHREILDVLWATNEATSVEIAQRLTDGPADSTVRSLLQIMDERGLVTHDGSSYRRKYRAAVTREAVEDAALNALLESRYDGSVDALLQDLVDNELLDVDALDRARSRLAGPPASCAPRPAAPTPVRSAKRNGRPRFSPSRPIAALVAGGVALGIALLIGRK